MTFKGFPFDFKFFTAPHMVYVFDLQYSYLMDLTTIQLQFAAACLQITFNDALTVCLNLCRFPIFVHYDKKIILSLRLKSFSSFWINS